MNLGNKKLKQKSATRRFLHIKGQNLVLKHSVPHFPLIFSRHYNTIQYNTIYFIALKFKQIIYKTSEKTTCTIRRPYRLKRSLPGNLWSLELYKKRVWVVHYIAGEYLIT